MAWVEPIYNRTSTSKYNTTDTNRVNTNTEYMADYLNTNGLGIIALEAYVTPTTASLGRVEVINLLERNINKLSAYLGTPPLYTVLNAGWGGIDGYSFMYNHANRLEQNLQVLKDIAENILQAVRYCGEIVCGEDMLLFVI